MFLRYGKGMLRASYRERVPNFDIFTNAVPSVGNRVVVGSGG